MKINRVLRVLPNLARAPELVRCARECRDWAALSSAYLGLGTPTYPREFRTRDGECLVLERFEDLATAWIIFIRRDYRVEPSSRTIIDAGANIGAFSLYAARSAPAARVIALEPFPTTFERLEAHVGGSRNGGRIARRPWALGRSDGLRRMDASPMASQFRGVVEDGGPAPSVPVEAITLATLWGREGLARVDLLKLDVEGSEYEVIGSTPPEVLRRIDEIVMEYHPGGSKAELFGRLRDAGFDLLWDEPAPATDYGMARFRLGRSRADGFDR